MLLVSAVAQLQQSNGAATSPLISRRTAFVPVVLLGLFNLADVVLTRYGLAHGAVEANPLARHMLSGGRVELAKVVLIALLCLRIEHRRPTFAMAVACWAAVGAYAMAVFSNAIVLASLH